MVVEQVDRRVEMICYFLESRKKQSKRLRALE